MAHTFAEDCKASYKYTPRLDWLLDQANNCQWKDTIPEILGLDDPDPEHDRKLHEFLKHHATETGALHWHMFCLTTYNYELRTPVEKINADKIIGYTNTTGNNIFTIEGAINPLEADKPQLDKHNAAFYGRLFNYYHCYLEGRVELFKLNSRPGLTKYKCPACACVFGSKGYVYENPTKDVIAESWTWEDKEENDGSGSSNVDEGTKI